MPLRFHILDPHTKEGYKVYTSFHTVEHIRYLLPTIYLGTLRALNQETRQSLDEEQDIHTQTGQIYQVSRQLQINPL